MKLDHNNGRTVTRVEQGKITFIGEHEIVSSTKQTVPADLVGCTLLRVDEANETPLLVFGHSVEGKPPVITHRIPWPPEASESDSEATDG